LMMKELKDNITESLLGFSNEDLNVSERNGRVYVSMSQDLLFAKGSSNIDAKGRDAIRKLAEVLKNHPNIRINVEGHTDTDGPPERNWDLSVTRATAVVKELTRLDVLGHRITASGRAYHDPITFNDTEENKSRNRRTEIILSPRLEDILEIVR
jgi:chemotaxis protein MotB